MMRGIDDRELDTVQYSDVCTYCKHYDGGFRTCAAFKEIPLSIWEGKNKHTKPVDGDHGIQFEKREA